MIYLWYISKFQANWILEPQQKFTLKGPQLILSCVYNYDNEIWI